MTNETDLIKAAEEALEIAKGNKPAARLHHSGHTYVPKAELEAAQARIAELERHLGGSLAVITDYLEYEHDGDPWTEDARTMGEMEINEYERSGRLKEARAALQEGKE